MPKDNQNHEEFDKELTEAIEEVLSETENEETTDAEEGEEDLNEFKASFGVAAEVPEPSLSQAPTRRGDNRNPEKKPHPQGSSRPKHGLIADLIKTANGMKSGDLNKKYGNIMKAMKEDYDETDDLDEGKKPLTIGGKSAEDLSREATKKIQNRRKKVTTEDIDISEDMSSIFDGTDITEEFKDKVSTLIETVIVNKINEQIHLIAADVETELAETSSAFSSELEERVDEYLDFVVEEWMKENEVAIETGLRSDITEKFMEGLKTLFTENYVDVPEEKIDVVEELSKQVEELSEKLTEAIEDNIELKKSSNSVKRDRVFEEIAEGLTETQKEKFRGLSEGVAFEDENDFADKITIIKENYFTESDTTTKSGAKSLTEEMQPLDEETEVKTPSVEMAPYIDAISRSVNK